MKMIKLRTTVTVEYEVADSVVDVRCNRLTALEQANWLSLYAKRYGEIVSARTECVEPQ